jgi:UV DNA damage endonuclease
LAFFPCFFSLLRHINLVSDSAMVCSLDSLQKNGIEWVKDLGKKNLEDMLQLIQWNEDNVCPSLTASHLLAHQIYIFAAHQVYPPFIERLSVRFARNTWLQPQG